MAVSLAKSISLIKHQGCSSEILKLSASLIRGTYFGNCRTSSNAPVPQKSGENLYGEDREGKYSPFQVIFIEKTAQL